MTILSKLKSLLSRSESEDTDETETDTKTTALLPGRGAYGVYKLTEDRIGYKAVRGGVMEVKIPEGATVVSPRNSRKLRTDKMIPLRAPMGKESVKSLSTFYIYEVGECNEPRQALDTDAGRECAPGLHFFRSRHKAVVWHYHHS